MNLSPAQLHTLRHMLGINTPELRVPWAFRNYAAVNPGDPEFAKLEGLGAVEQYTPKVPGDYVWYRCTDAGRLAAMQSFKTIRHKKSARVYRRYLDISDCYPDLTFEKFLTDPQFAETRRNA